MIETHREVFTRFLRTAARDGGKVAEEWHEWLSNQNIVRCDFCLHYGELGIDMTYIGDTGTVECLAAPRTKIPLFSPQ